MHPCRIVSLIVATTILLVDIVICVEKFYEWEIGSILAAPDGFYRYSIGVNGASSHLSGIHATVGDIISVKVTNSLKEPTAIHWHGMRQEGTLISDGAVSFSSYDIMPGQSFTYRYRAFSAGTFWWHSHYKTQYVDGLHGPLIIEPEKANTYIQQHVVQISDWYHQSHQVLESAFLNGTLNPNGNEPVWSSGLINGKGVYDCSWTNRTMPDCRRQRHQIAKFSFDYGREQMMRFINMGSFAAFNISIEDHVMQVVEMDGNPTYISNPVSSFVLNVAQRISVVLRPTFSGYKHQKFMLSATLLDDSPWTSLPLDEEDPGLVKIAKAEIQYRYQPLSTNHQFQGYSDQRDNHSCQDLFMFSPLAPSLSLDMIQPLETSIVPTGVADQRLLFDFSIGSNDVGTQAFVTTDRAKNASSYVVPMVPTAFDLLVNNKAVGELPESSNAVEIFDGSIVDVVIINRDGGQHPIHMHGHSFWVMSSGFINGSSTDIDGQIPKSFESVTPPVFLKRDTTTLEACSSSMNDDTCDIFSYNVIRFIADNPGIWAFHCKRM